MQVETLKKRAAEASSEIAYAKVLWESERARAGALYKTVRNPANFQLLVAP